TGIKVQEEVKFKAAKPPMSDQEFRNFLDSVGHMIKPEEFRISIYQGGCEPSLRRVAWRHLLNIFPNGLSGKERFEYMKRKEKEYFDLRDHWKRLVNGESMSEEMKFVTSMVKKDVLRTDRTHKFYSGSDDNKNLISLFNVLVTFALTHPETSYCQGMSDIASPLLVTQKDEAQTYLCFCAMMRRLKNNFNINGQAITMKFKHLSDLLHVHDSELHSYFQKINASDMFFCYRWILLELKREFPFEDALYMLEVMWSTLPPDPPSLEVPLVDESFSKENLSHLPCSPSFGIQQTVYAKLNAMRRQKSILKNNSSLDGENKSEQELAQKSVNNNSRTTDIFDESSSVVNSQEYPVLNDTETRNMVVKSSSIDGSLRHPVEKSHDDKEENFLEKDSHFQNSLDNDKNIPENDEIAVYPSSQFTKEKVISLNEDGNSEKSTNMCIEGHDNELLQEEEQSQFYISLDESQENKTNASGKVVSTDGVCEDSDVFAAENAYPDPDNKDCNLSQKEKIGSSCRKHVFTHGLNDISTNSEKEILRQEKPGTQSVNFSTEYNSSCQSEQLNLSNSLEIVKHDDDKNACLPAPQDFGCGNPFLMFLCLSLLQQHRDRILQKKLEYDEIAIMFDKLVRKHDVHKVLHYSRCLYSEYLRTQQKISESNDEDPSV
ncbi:TBC1 domain family member 25-like, partial [Saccostrea cucullata]|uniref:TBC1 domain family member 25-like n=1 Tax=Saccostrea cuccullata TaxID=36930 RepID=UPI002ED69CB7